MLFDREEFISRRGAISIREFHDGSGERWQVWHVHPTFTTVRSGDERRKLSASVRTDRRIGSERRSATPPDWINGWLCFESKREKRRLAPVPEQWEESPVEKLREFCKAAVTTLRRGI